MSSPTHYYYWHCETPTEMSGLFDSEKDALTDWEKAHGQEFMVEGSRLEVEEGAIRYRQITDKLKMTIYKIPAECTSPAQHEYIRQVVTGKVSLDNTP